jgi:hypothetical protein
MALRAQKLPPSIHDTVDGRTSGIQASYVDVCLLNSYHQLRAQRMNIRMTDALFGMGRNATGITALPCPRRAVFEIFPADAYTGWYSWWPVATDTVVLSLPEKTGTNIEPYV